MTAFYSDAFAAAIANATIDLSQQRLYAVLLESAPLRSYTQRSQLDEPEDANYQVQAVNHTWTSNQLTITVSPTFPQHTSAADLVTHVALCYRAGGAPATTDLFCWASSLRELSQLIAAPASLQFTPLLTRFPSTPILNFAATAPVFPGGTYNIPLENTTQGIIARLGTNNYATGTYTNPIGTGTTAAQKVRLYSGAVAFTNLTGLGGRTPANTGAPLNATNTNNAIAMLDFFGGDGSLGRNILASRIAFSCNCGVAGTASLQLSVGSSIPALTPTNISNDLYFTTIGSIALPTTAQTTTLMLDTIASSYERFLRLKYVISAGAPTHNFSLFELFDPSRLQSPTTTL